MFKIANIRASVEGKDVLKGVSFICKPGKVHVVMGPNGSGKSTLANVLMGHPGYVAKGTATLKGKNILKVPPEDRARAGLFLAFQSPVAIPGVTVVSLLREAYQEIHGSKVKISSKAKYNPNIAKSWKGNISLVDFMAKVKATATELRIDEAFLKRGVHDGFSGGEKKKIEMLEALVLSPQYAIFDEIDTGLDVDALRVVARGIELLKEAGTGVIIITHYQRILDYVKPDVVHVLIKGKIVKTGTGLLAKEIEKNGYKKYAGTS